MYVRFIISEDDMRHYTDHPSYAFDQHQFTLSWDNLYLTNVQYNIFRCRHIKKRDLHGAMSCQQPVWTFVL